MESVSNSSPAFRITNDEHIASYNWLDRPEPTIMVPGVPAKWSVPAGGLTVPPDSESMRFDSAGDLIRSSMEPLLQSVLAQNPSYDFSKVNIITDRFPLALLLEYVMGAKGQTGFLNSRATRGFHIGVRIAGNTAVFFNIYKLTWQEKRPGMFHFRREFEKASCVYEADVAAESVSHHRIKQYDFGGFKILMRYAVDAYDETRVPVSSELVHDAGEETDTGDLRVVRGGRQIPPGALLELSTRAKEAKRLLTVRERMQNLWLSQTALWAKCLHTSDLYRKDPQATFDDISMYEVNAEGNSLLKRFEEENAPDMRRLAGLIGNIIQNAKELGVATVVSYNGKGGALEIAPAEEKDIEVPALPQGLKA